MTTGTCRAVPCRRDVEPTAGHRPARNPADEPRRQNAGPATPTPEERRTG